ncbi:hypothetical protein V6N13_052225 [Hibiscus sabdariffa]|uniref:Uncharacterized protein n=1 Tax=Hibiscus sabdariffa TaxID=183260 RepID=A0ABR2BIJ4_9ROSI
MGKDKGTSLCESEMEELRRMPLVPLPLTKTTRSLSKQLSMCKTCRDISWERRRRQQRGKNGLTDEDLHELRGCIDLGFRFNEQDCHKLCNTLPALDLYFAVNRQLPVSTGHSRRSSSISSLGGSSSSSASPVSEPADWKICSPGENPEQVKAKLRHWAQAVACSLIQSYE